MVMLSTVPDMTGYTVANRLAWLNVIDIYNTNINRLTSYAMQLGIAFDGTMEYVSDLKRILEFDYQSSP
jgi:hypothetical protein